MERTFVSIKPDGFKRGLYAKIIQRFIDKGYNIVGLKKMNVDLSLAEKHYGEHIGKPFYPGLIKYITSGPIIAMVIEGVNVIEQVRRIIGATNPNVAEIGTIRADFAQIMENNVIHGSDSAINAEREIGLFFNETELCE